MVPVQKISLQEIALSEDILPNIFSEVLEFRRRFDLSSAYSANEDGTFSESWAPCSGLIYYSINYLSTNTWGTPKQALQVDEITNIFHLLLFCQRQKSNRMVRNDVFGERDR